MTHTVHVRHPVSFRYVPERGRNEQFVWGHGVTPVELPEVERRDLTLVTVLRDLKMTTGEIPVYAGGAALWIPPRGERGQPVPLETFVRYLESAAGTGLGDLYSCFLRTPVCMSEAGKPASRGGDVTPPPNARLLEDGYAKAAARLRDFIARDVVVRDGEVFMRCRGPLVEIGPEGGLAYSVFPQRTLTPGRICHPARLRELWDLLQEHGLLHAKAGPFPGLRPEVAHLPLDLIGDEDIALTVNKLPYTVRSTVRSVINKDSDPGRLALLREIERALLPFERDGLVGCVGPEAQEEVLLRVMSANRACAEAIREALARGEAWATRWNPDYLEGTLAVKGGFLLPRVQEPQAALEDHAALTALGPAL